jgi:hypothetical protein
MAKEKRLVILSVRVSDALAEAVKALAEADTRTVSNYIENLLKKHVAEHGYDIGEPKKAEKPKGKGKS